MRKPKAIVFTPLLLALGLAIACGGAATPTPGPTTAATTGPITTATQVPGVTPQPTPTPSLAIQPKYRGTIPMHDFSFPQLNFIPYEGLTQVMSWSGIYNQLVEYNPETEEMFDLMGDLAKSWELAANGMTYTFHLHYAQLKYEHIWCEPC